MTDLIFNIILIISNYIEANYFLLFVVYLFFLIVFFSLSLPGGIIIFLASGFFFGFIPGFLINVLSTSLGSLIFIIYSKTIMKKLFNKYYHKYSIKISNYIDNSSFEYLVLIRLIFGPPLIFQNICISLMNVSKIKIFISSLIGFTPLMLLFSYTGSYISDIIEIKEFSFSQMISFEIILIASFLIVLTVFKIFYKK
tara:strand:+ start:1690 stop:2280 length:591 start_codon:yes stop_codon:yes gene_type:complete